MDVISAVYPALLLASLQYHCVSAGRRRYMSAVGETASTLPLRLCPSCFFQAVPQPLPTLISWSKTPIIMSPIRTSTEAGPSRRLPGTSLCPPGPTLVHSCPGQETVSLL